MDMHLSRTILAVGCGLAITACGSSSSPVQDSGSPRARGIAFADCMRSHGVPSFPDPSAGGGIHITPGSGIDPAAPAFQAAQSQCAKLLPGGGPGKGHASAQVKAEMVATSRCMRAHGVSGFPDPTVSPPANPGAYSLAMGRDGVFLAVPRTIDVNSPVFQRAASACRFGAPGGPGGPGGGHAAPATRG
jgi:hypothetical protein